VEHFLSTTAVVDISVKVDLVLVLPCKRALKKSCSPKREFPKTRIFENAFSKRHFHSKRQFTRFFSEKVFFESAKRKERFLVVGVTWVLSNGVLSL
jgi:hypothetical protein